MLCVSTVDGTPLHDFQIFYLKIRVKRERVLFLLGKGKNCEKTRKRRKEREIQHKKERLLGKGKNCKKPGREEKKGKYDNTTMA